MASNDENFNLADKDTDDRTIDALNASFNSISEMCDEYVNYERPQDYAIFSYVGPLTVGEPISLGFNVGERTSVWGINIFASNQAYSYLGVANNNIFTPSYSASYVFIFQAMKRVY